MAVNSILKFRCIRRCIDSEGGHQGGRSAAPLEPPEATITSDRAHAWPRKLYRMALTGRTPRGTTQKSHGLLYAQMCDVLPPRAPETTS
eukprot:5431010-Pleurochrysis_carterae.AAC.3